MDPPLFPVIPIALSGLKRSVRRGCCVTRFQWHVQRTPNLGLQTPTLEQQELEPNRHEELQIYGVNPRTLFLVKLRNLDLGEWSHALALENGTHEGGVLVVLVERTQCQVPEQNILVQRERFDLIVVDADPAVRVADRHVESEVIVESVVGGVVEAREGGVCDVEFDHVGAHDKPEQKSENCQDYDDCGQDLAD